MTTPTITLLVPNFSIVSDPITNAKSLQFDVNLGANIGGSPTSRLEALSFEMRVSGFPTTGFTVPSDQSTWFTDVNSSLLPGLQNFSSDIQFTQTVPGVLNLNWGWYTATGITPQVDNKLFTVKIPLGSGGNLSQSIFKLEALTPIEAVFETGAPGSEVDTNATLSTGPRPPDLNSDLYVAPKLTSITSKVGGLTATDGSDIDTALDVKANQDIEVTFTFSKSIQSGSFNFDDLEFNQMAQQGSLTAVDATNTVFKATFNPTDMNTWNGSVGIKAGAMITGTNGLALDMTAMPTPLQFAGDTLVPMTPSVQVEDIGVPGAGGGNSTTDGVVNKVVLRSTGADSTNTQTINYYVDGASSPTASVSGSTTMGTGTTLDLADGAHTVRAQAIDAAGNVSDMSTAINFTVDTKAPMVSLVESVSSIPGITTTPPSSQYFRVQFSEDVIQVNPNDFRVLNADGSVNSTATITSVYRGASGSMADTYTPEDDYYVVVNSAGQTNLSVGVVPVVNISATTPYTGITPTGALLQSTATVPTQEDLTGGAWVKIDLNNPVTTLPTSSGWLTTTSSQAGITAPYVLATAPGSTTQSFYAYVKSTTSGTALDVSKLSFNLNYQAGGNTGSQSFGASITDLAGNSLLSDPMLDDQAAINASTPTLASNSTFITRPATGVGGFDTLDLSALSSAKPIDVVAEQRQIIVQGASSADTKVYRIENFDEFIISNASGVNFRGTMAASEVVQLTAPISSNDIRLANRPQSDLSPETDIVDYSATSNAVTVNLGSTTNGGDGWFYATATKGALGVGGVDKIAGAEGIFGSTVSDTITGGLRDNLLAGGAGNDRLDGAAGNDILDGGAGTGDILIGGSGKDILIDLDGATLTGGTSKKNQGASGDKDVFVVRNGSTIENFHVAKDGAGLAGRAAASANDTILFNLSVGILSEKLTGYNAAVAGKSTSQLQVELAKIKKDIDIRVEKITIDGDNTADDWAVIASYNGGLHAASVELARVIVKDMNATVMPGSSVLTDVALPDFSLKNAVSEDIDQLIFSQVSDLLVDDQAINLAVALESVRQGTVREVKAGGLMFGDFSLTERIFNPGVGSEKIFGSNKKDTYEFLVQDLKSSNGNSTSDAGMDQILDTGGDDDTVAFSSITRDKLNQLDFTAAKLGLETGHYSLSSNYSQSAEGITNTGGFTWTGHFRDGFDMELEQISLGDATLAMADVRYDYDAEGNILNWTPDQVAISGKDTIMVGGVGRSADASRFVVEKGATFNDDIGTDKTQQLYIWDADANAVTGDVIDLKAFFNTKGLAQAAVQTSVETNPFETSIKASSSFKIDLDANNDLILNFMDINLTKESLDEMIARAYGT